MRLTYLSVVVSLLISACGGGGSGGTAPQVGQFIDDPVGGLAYSCVSGAQTITGTTNDQGQFNYLPGQTCTFKVGNVTLGTLTGIPSDGKVTPQDVAGVSRSATAAPSALAIAQFLQSLNDGSSSGKIVIPAATSTLLSSAQPITLVSSSGTIAPTALRTLVETVPGKTLVSAAAAQNALDTQIASGNVNQSTGSVSPTATPVLNSITVTSAASSNAAGLTEQFTATGYYSDGSNSNITNSVVWSSSDTSLLTINSSGLGTGIKKGGATVFASLTPSGATTAIKGSIVQTTTDPILLSIAVTNSANPPAGLTDQLTAMGTYSDGTTANLTSSVTWTSSDSNKLTVSTSGLARGVAVGSATVTASYTPSVGGTAITGTRSESVLDPTPLNIVISYVTSGITSIQNTANTLLQAILNFSDSTTQTVSSLVQWAVTSVSDGGNATVAVNTTNNTATLTGTSPGVISTIARYLGLTSNSLSLTVTPLTSISGVTASGAAMSGATVSASCQGLTTSITAVSRGDGSYSITLPAGVTAPCLLSSTVVDGNNNSTTFYSSVASDTGSSNVTANITPITHLSVANAIGMDPSTVSSLSSVAGSLTSTKLNSAAGVVQTALNTTFGIAADGLARPFDSAIVPANPDSGLNTNKQDFAIDQVMQLLNASSTPISQLVNVVSQSTSTNVASAMTNFVSTNSIPTSTADGCPYATSGDYAIASVGSTNFRGTDTPNFGIVRIDFRTKKAWDGTGEQYAIQADVANPCLFHIQSTTSKKYISFTVSRAGFLVATSFAPPASTVKTPSMRPTGPGNECLTSDSYCSTFQIGIPVQSGIRMSELTGTWAQVSWNLSKFTHQTTSTIAGVTTVNANSTSEFPCLGSSNGGSNNGQTSDGGFPFTCSQYVSYLEKAVIERPTNSGTAAVAIYGCDGLYQGADKTKTCSTSNQYPTTPLKMVMCSVMGDCPTASITVNGTTSTVTLRSVIDTVEEGTNTVVSRSIAYRTPDNDLLTIGIGGAGGPTMNETAFNQFGNKAFQERLIFSYKPNGLSIPFPSVGSVATKGQWIAMVWNSGIQSATISNSGSVSQMTATVKPNNNPVTVGQRLVGNFNFGADTYITAVTGSGDTAVYTLSKRVSAGSYSNFTAISQQVKEVTQVYTVTDVSGKAVTRKYSNASDSDSSGNGYSDTVYLDTPVIGLIYRSPVFIATSVNPVFSESISARGHGFAISIGTGTIRQQLGGIPAGKIAVGCTMPGQTYAIPANGNSDGATSYCGGVGTTGKFFTINLTN